MNQKVSKLPKSAHQTILPISAPAFTEMNQKVPQNTKQYQRRPYENQTEPKSTKKFAMTLLTHINNYSTHSMNHTVEK